MFKDINENIIMLEGAYRKLKSYYYYNKNFLLMRAKIAAFEYDRAKMKSTFEVMAAALCHPRASQSKNYWEQLLDEVDFFVLPKKFDTSAPAASKPVSNTLQRDKKMKAVNFFIDAPIELFIYDTLWTIFAAKMENDKSILSLDVYGNTINKSALFHDDDIAFDSRVLFNRYFNRYSSWRNNAFKALEREYESKRDAVLLSLDIKSYYYSVVINFKKLDSFFGGHELLKKIKPLSDLLEKAYLHYYSAIAPFRNDLSHLRNNEYPLPIGLFSSMVLGNIYLHDFDAKVRAIPGVRYYGRYVDDILLVISKSIPNNATNQDILEDVFIKTSLFTKNEGSYQLVGYRALYVQAEKVKIVYIDHAESRAIIDIYNNTIRIIPSQMDPLPDSNFDLPNFDEYAYSIENFSKENKIRDIGFLSVDAFRVGKFFSSLPRKYAHINIFGADINAEIDAHISQISKFYSGSQGVEYYTSWLNFAYFLVITQRNKQLRKFVAITKKQIQSLKSTSLDKTMYKRTVGINKRVKVSLLRHLEICLEIALSLDIDMAKNHFNAHLNNIYAYICSNMFEHSFVALPLANYLEYTTYESYSKMSLSMLGIYPNNVEKSFKFIWSPRFIHYDELLLLLFYHYHKENKHGCSFKYVKERLVEKYSKINHIRYEPFMIDSSLVFETGEYVLEKLIVPSAPMQPPQNVNIAVGSVNLSVKKCMDGCNRWKNITFKDKKLLFGILRETNSCFNYRDRGTMLLVLPEMYFPIYWIGDLIQFAKRSQIAVVTGLQYLGDGTGQMYNYLATILPFKSGKMGYKNCFVHIREKNDYSPLEFEALAKVGLFCRNRSTANYQVFYWKGVRITPIVCYELTDIMARAILRGHSDIIAASVFNPDTSYFSNIIDSAVRDLHAFIVQANTSYLGDSRVSGPYDRDSRDIFKIKGGDNDHVVIGTIEFRKLKNYQNNYYIQMEKRLAQVKSKHKSKKQESSRREKEKPDIKPLSARFKNR